MMGYGFGPGSMWGLSFHMVFMWLVLVGTVLFFLWAAKALSKEQLKQWVVWALVLGLIGSFLTAGMGWNGWSTGSCTAAGPN